MSHLFLTAVDWWRDSGLSDRSPSAPSWTWSQISSNSLNRKRQTCSFTAPQIHPKKVQKHLLLSSVVPSHAQLSASEKGFLMVPLRTNTNAGNNELRFPAERRERRTDDCGNLVQTDIWYSEVSAVLFMCLSCHPTGGEAWGRGLEDQPIRAQHHPSVQGIDDFFFCHLYWFGQWQM